MLCAPVGAFARIAETIAPSFDGGRGVDGCRVHQAKSVICDVGPFAPAGVRTCAGASVGGHGIFRSRFRIHHTVPGALDATDAAAGAPG